MPWTKRQLIVQAYEDASMASYVFDLTPEDMQSALRKLDAMMAMWALKDIEIGYTASIGVNDGDLDQDSGIPTSAVFAVTTNLAKSIANMHGKTPPPQLMIDAKEGFEALCRRSQIPEMPRQSTMPRGAGNRRWNSGEGFGRFFRRPQTGPVQNTPDGELNLGE